MTNRIEYDASLKSLVLHNAVHIDGQAYDLTIRLRSSGVVLNEKAYNQYLNDEFLEYFQIDRVNEIAQSCFESIRQGYSSEIKNIAQVAVQIQDIGDNKIYAKAIIANDGLRGLDVLKDDRDRDIKRRIEEDRFYSDELQELYDELDGFDGMGINGLADSEEGEGVNEDETTPEIDEPGITPLFIPFTAYPSDHQKKWLKNKYNEWKENHKDWLYSQRSWWSGRRWPSVWENIDFETKDPYRPKTFTASEQATIEGAIKTWKEKAARGEKEQGGIALFFEGFTDEDIQEFLGLDPKLKHFSAETVIQSCLIDPLFNQWLPQASS